jgi:hypothetical protein
MLALTATRTLPYTARNGAHVRSGHDGGLGQMSDISGMARLAGTVTVALTTVALKRWSRLVELIELVSAKSQV